MWSPSAQKESAVLSGFEGVCGVVLWCLAMFGGRSHWSGCEKVVGNKSKTNPNQSRNYPKKTKLIQ